MAIESLVALTIMAIGLALLALYANWSDRRKSRTRTTRTTAEGAVSDEALLEALTDQLQEKVVEARRTLDEAVALAEKVTRESARRHGNADKASTLDTGARHG